MEESGSELNTGLNLGLNYCLIKKNKIYEHLQDMMDIEEISMNDPNQNEKVFYHIKKLISKSKFIELRGNENDTNSLLEEIMLGITEDNKSEEIQGNTLLVYGDDDAYYEVIYMENLINTKRNNDELNEFGSLSNISLEPIYWDCAIVKTGFKNNQTIPKKISIDDIVNIFINNFYHKGVMIDTDGKTTELIYSGETPHPVIGSKFERYGEIKVLGIVIVPWVEKSNTINNIGTKLLESEMKGRIFLTILSPISFKRYWGISIQSLNNILSILDNKEKVNKVNDEIIESNYTINPFFLIKKYCI
jgi:hypothetical protein